MKVDSKRRKRMKYCSGNCTGKIDGWIPIYKSGYYIVHVFFLLFLFNALISILLGTIWSLGNKRVMEIKDITNKIIVLMMDIYVTYIDAYSSKIKTRDRDV